MFEVYSLLGEETQTERLTRICALPNRANNPKCIAFKAGLPITPINPTTIPPGPPSFGGDTVPGVIPGGGIVAVGPGSAGAVGGGSAAGASGGSFFSALPWWAWAGIGLGAFFILKRK